MPFHKTPLMLSNLLRVVLDQVSPSQAVQRQTWVFVDVDDVEELWEGSWRQQIYNRSDLSYGYKQTTNQTSATGTNRQQIRPQLWVQTDNRSDLSYRYRQQIRSQLWVQTDNKSDVSYGYRQTTNQTSAMGTNRQQIRDLKFRYRLSCSSQDKYHLLRINDFLSYKCTADVWKKEHLEI